MDKSYDPGKRIQLLEHALKKYLARDLEVAVENLDPKDVMRYDSEAYIALYVVYP